MVTRSVPRPVRRTVRAGLVLAAGIVVIGATGGTAFAGLGQFTRPSPDGGPEVRTHGVHAADGDRQTNDRRAGKITPDPGAKAKPKADTGATANADAAATKAATKAKSKAKAKARVNLQAASRNKVAHKPKPRTKATWKAPYKAAAPDVVIAAAPPAHLDPPAAPHHVTAVASGTAGITVSWTVDAGATGIVDHFEATAVQDPAKTCRTRTNAATSCTVPSVAAGTSYTFTVRAIGVDGADDSVPSVASAPATVAAATGAGTAAAAAATDPAAADAPVTQDGMIANPAALHRRTTVKAPDRTAADAQRRIPGADKGREATSRDTTSSDTASSDTASSDTTLRYGAQLGLPDGSAGAAAAVAAPDVADRSSGARTGVLALLGLAALITAGLATAGVTRRRRTV